MKQLLDRHSLIYFGEWGHCWCSETRSLVSYNGCMHFLSCYYVHNVPFPCNINTKFQGEVVLMGMVSADKGVLLGENPCCFLMGS